jgi:hypothetical protein
MMATGKMAALGFRVKPGLKESLQSAAELDRRGTTNMVEVMIPQCCRPLGATIVDSIAAGVSQRQFKEY